MPAEIRRKALIFLLVTVILTALIAAALPRLVLKPGEALPALEGGGETLSQASAPALSISFNTYFKAALEIVLVLVICYSAYQIVKGVPWKKVLAPALLLATLVMAGFYIFFVISGARIQSDPFEPEVLPPDLTFAGRPLGPPPPGLIWLAWIGLAVGVSLLGIWLLRRRSQRLSPARLLELEAERALRALRSGSDLNNVIVRCYLQMSQALQKEQKIELRQTMTARDFEELLEGKGYPPAPVRQLTELFEAARYGFRQMGPADDQKALESLNAILTFSRAGGKPEGHEN